MSDTPLVLVDGTSWLFRAFHALPPLSTSGGVPTGVVFGMVQMLRRFDKEHPGARAVIVFDAPGPTFRHTAFPEYKAHRPALDPDLAVQINPAKAVTRALGLPVLELAGVEADDVIATLACAAVARGEAVLISTPDKDFAQLVGPLVSVLNPLSGTVFDAEGVRAKFGVGPERIADYLALVGDAADGIPGVPGVGPKTAAKWLIEHGSLDGVMAQAASISGKVGEALRTALPQLPLYRDLATVRTDLELELDLQPDTLVRQSPDVAALRAIYTECEFRGLLRELDAQPGAASPMAQRGAATRSDIGSPPVAPSADPMSDPGGLIAARAGYECVLTTDQLEHWCALLAGAELFAVDLETTSLDPLQADIVGIALAVAPGVAAYIPVAHGGLEAPQQLAPDEVLQRLRPLLQDAARPKVLQNLKYDLAVFARAGIALAGAHYDTMLESYVLDATATRHDMDSLAARYLQHTPISFKEVAGSGRAQITFDQVPLPQATTYAAEDADVTLRLHHCLWPQLAGLPGPRRVFENIEMPLVPVLARIEGAGVRVDGALLRAQSAELAQSMARTEAAAHEAAGHPFNIASPTQLGAVLFDELGLKPTRRTPKGAPSTAEDALTDLAPLHRLPELVLEYRTLAKLKSTYTDKLPTMIHPRTGRVHTNYHQAVAATGRLSSVDPNLQNIPVRTAEGRRIRQAFVADPGCVLLAADYSQIELRIMAHLSGDDALIASFEAGEDIHRATAAGLNGIALDAVTPEQRRAAKAVNFGLIYGMSAFGLAQQLGVDRGHAQRILDDYFVRYPGVRVYMDATREHAREHGYVETLYGRRLTLPDIRSRDGGRRQYAERAAINAPMQGTAADLIKLAMIRVDAALRAQGLAARMILQVHDELVFEVPQAELPALQAQVPEWMCADNPLRVPLSVDVGVGANWDEAH